MYKQGFSPTSTVGIMNEVGKEKGKEGNVHAQTMRNMNVKMQTAMDVAAGVDKDWTIAQRTLKKLNEYVDCLLRIMFGGVSTMNSHYLVVFEYTCYSLKVSHVALVINKEGELLIYKK